jgi:hypothetical protein
MHSDDAPGLPAPTRAELDKILFEAFGRDKKFLYFMGDHWDGVAPPAHARLWEKLRLRRPDATTHPEVVGAWTKDEVVAAYREALREVFRSLAASSDITRR